MNTISNYCRFIGRLTDAPKVVAFENTSLCAFTLAVSEYRKEKNGEKKISKYCQKGDIIDLVASARNNSWTDKNGNKRFSTKFRVKEFKLFNAEREKQEQLS